MTARRPFHLIRPLLSCLMSVLLALVLLQGFRISSASAEQVSPSITENEWNFVDQSLDISNGIPKGVSGALAEIRMRGVLRVVTSPWYPPQEYIDETRTGQEQYVGADMELARLIALRMGVSLEILPVEFSAVLSTVAGGEADLAVSALSYTPARSAMVELSRGYHYPESHAGTGLLVRAEDAGSYPDAASLGHSVLAAQRGSLQESLGAEHFPDYLEFRRFSSVQEVYNAVESGEADVAVVDADIARTYLTQHPDSSLTLLPQFHFQLEEILQGDRIAARKGELELIAFVNGVIEEVLASGQYEQWFDEFTAAAE